MILTQEQLLSYDKQGFLHIPNFVSDKECDLLMEEASNLIDGFDPEETKTIFSTYDQSRVVNDYFMGSSDTIRFFLEADAMDASFQLKQEPRLSMNKMGHALHDLNPVFERFSRQEKLKTLCHDLGYVNPLLMQSMYIFKQPRIGGEVTCHQDSTFLFTEPLSVVGFWFALQDATLENGCLYALPEGHKDSLKRKFVRNSEGGMSFEELDQTPWPEEGYVPLEAKKGSLIVLHGLLPHKSCANTSDISRHAYTLHVLEGGAYYPKENWLQRSMPARGF